MKTLLLIVTIFLVIGCNKEPDLSPKEELVKNELMESYSNDYIDTVTIYHGENILFSAKVIKDRNYDWEKCRLFLEISFYDYYLQVIEFDWLTSTLSTQKLNVFYDEVAYYVIANNTLTIKIE